MTRLATLLRSTGLPVLATILGLSALTVPAFGKRHSDLAETQVELTERCASTARDAIEACTLAITGEARARRRADLLSIRGWHESTAGNHHAALGDFDASLKLEPGGHGAARGRAVTLSELGRYDEAVAAIDRSEEHTSELQSQA